MARKVKRAVVNAVAHIHVTQNNTIVTFADPAGDVLAWSSAGAIGYKGSKKSTPYAAGLAAESAAKKAMEHGVRSVKVAINGTGQGKDTAVRAIQALGLEISEINDRTPIPHNGCRPPKKPR